MTIFNSYSYVIFLFKYEIYEKYDAKNECADYYSRNMIENHLRLNIIKYQHNSSL